MQTPDSSIKVKPSEVVSVSWINRAAREALEGSFPLMWIAGEVSTLTQAASGHLYFTLKDKEAQVRCTMWRNKAQHLAFRLEHGMQVEVRALVTLFEPRGDYQLNVESIRQAGLGHLYEAFLRLKSRLQAEGLFDAGLKRALPRFPRGVAVVTSPQAAAWKDVIATLARRAPHLPLWLYPTQVQGASAPALIAEAIRLAGTRALIDGNDLLLLVRGGGSLEDLAAFNDERVARAIRACPIPVIVGVGHETDVSIADFAADVRAATPTAAAELASSGFVELQDTLQHLALRLQRSMTRRFEHAAQRLDRVAARLVHPRQRLESARLRLESLDRRLQVQLRTQLTRGDHQIQRLRLRLEIQRPDLPPLYARLHDLQRRLHRSAQAALELRQRHVETLAQHLSHLDPRNVLARGYSITRNQAGTLVRDPADVSPGSIIQVEFHTGQISASVLEKHPPDLAPELKALPKAHPSGAQ